MAQVKKKKKKSTMPMIYAYTTPEINIIESKIKELF